MWPTRHRWGHALLVLAALALSGCQAPPDDPVWAHSGLPTPGTPAAQAQPNASLATPLPPPSPSPGPTLLPTTSPLVQLLATYPVSGDMAVPPERPLSLVFDAPMDRASVEAAMSISPQVTFQFTWESDRQLVATPSEPWSVGTEYILTLNDSAHSTSGGRLAANHTLTFGSGGAGAPIPVLMYHHFGHLDATASQSALDWTVSPEALTEQLAYLQSHAWHTITPTQLADYLAEGKPLPVKPLMITIDDGYREVRDVAHLFVESGLMPVLFVVTDYTEYSAYLSWPDLAELVAQGFAIGSHSMDHSSLREISDAARERQIVGSKALLEERLGVPVDAFCYPSGSFNQHTKELLAQNGYRIAFSLNETIYQQPDDPFFIGRMRIDYRTTCDDLSAILPQ